MQLLTRGLLAILVTLLCACDSGPRDKAMTRHTLLHDGLTREYFVFEPSSYEEQGTNPLLVFMHGYGGSATGTETEVTQGLNAYAERHGYVVVYPQSTWFMAEPGTPEQWEVSSWNHISDGFDRGPAGPICSDDVISTACPPECGDCGRCGWASCHDDVGFLLKLVAELEASGRIDNVFVAGFSNGAMMSHRIACAASEVFDAAALIGGRLEPGFECTPARPIPLLQVNGAADPVVPHDGSESRDGYFFADTRSVASHWSGDPACASELQPWLSPALEGSNAECTLQCGNKPYESIDCLWPDSDHRWPGTPGTIGSNGYCVSELQAESLPEQALCVEPDREAEIWGSALLFEFFDRYRRD